MADQGYWNKVKSKWLRRHKVIIVDEHSLETEGQFSIQYLRLLVYAIIILIITGICTIILFTQTPMIKLLGNRPKAFLKADYKELADEIDSLKVLSAIRDKQLEVLQKVITRSVSLPEKNSNSEKTSPSNAEAINRNSNQWTANNQKILQVAGPLDIFLVPIDGEVTSRYDPERDHMGIDLAAKADAYIHAIADGYVVYRGYQKEDGWVLKIQHANGFLSAYKHNEEILVSSGMFVKKGDRIAIIGNTGEFSTGPHLHFELWRGNAQINPETYISFK